MEFWARGHADISIHAPLTGSDTVNKWVVEECEISIHAPLTGSDCRYRSKKDDAGDFNPRSPYGERLSRNNPNGCKADFNPRSPYGERHGENVQNTVRANFNPRSPYGERLFPPCCAKWQTSISIHAPLTGSDTAEFDKNDDAQGFQSTLPLRGATGS